MHNTNSSTFHGKRVTLMGFARTNVALARYLARQGADITMTDSKSFEDLAIGRQQLESLNIRYVLGHHEMLDFTQADVVFVSPGVQRTNPFVQAAMNNGIPVSSEIELFFELCKSPIAAITGSAGKTTTTTLVGEMLAASGFPTFVGGNIGIPLIDRLDELSEDARVVLELSSFQLEPMRRSAHVAAVLNITPNHLDRHPTFEAYRDAKTNIFKFQRPDDVTVLSLDDPGSAQLISQVVGQPMLFSVTQPVIEGACLYRGELVLTIGLLEGTICRRDEVRLRGLHNVQNILAASVIAAVRGASMEAIRSVATQFTGVEHRIEPVRVLDGCTWFNDSKATSPTETMAALRSFTEPIVLMAGGRSKKAPLDEMAADIVTHVRHLVVFGEMAGEIADAVTAQPKGNSITIDRAHTVKDAVELARRAARPGDVVLLSPSGTSFDAFDDYEHRGRVFKDIVLQLQEHGTMRSPAE